MKTLNERLDALLYTFQTKFDLTEVPTKTFAADGGDVDGVRLFEIRGPHIRWGRAVRLSTPNTLSVMIAPSMATDLPYIGLDLTGADVLQLAVLDVAPLHDEPIAKIAVYLDADVPGMRVSTQHLPPAVQAMLGPSPWMGRSLADAETEAVLAVAVDTFEAWKKASQSPGEGNAITRHARLTRLFETHHASALSRGTFQKMFGSDEAAERFVKSFFFPEFSARSVV